jgi:hypothetical protein
MSKKIFISLILISLIVFGVLFFNFKKTETFAAEPIAAMKTLASDQPATPYDDTGYFYIPALKPKTLKVVKLFDSNLEGDQSGPTQGEPDGIVNMRDVTFVDIFFNLKEGDSGWNYMADVVPDKIISMRDTSLIIRNLNRKGDYITDLTNVTIQFDTGGEFPLNPDGTLSIPNGATSFVVKKNGNPIGAYVFFYEAQVSACNDSDGENKLVKGTCTDASGSYTDSCIDATHIKEYKCNPAGDSCVEVADTNCPADYPNCVNGACVAAAAKTCAQLGGTCCPAGQTCIAGKISGASDCLECCSNVANCQSGGIGGGFLKLINPLACNTIPECIEKIISFILWIATAIFPIVIIIGGFLFLISGGDPEKVRTAKRVIFWGVIGLLIVLIARGIISVIKAIISK